MYKCLEKERLCIVSLMFSQIQWLKCSASWHLWAYLRSTFVHCMVENVWCFTDASGQPEILYKIFYCLNLSSLQSWRIPVIFPSQWFPPVLKKCCFFPGRSNFASLFIVSVVLSDPRASVFAWGERRESWGNIIFELFSKMTALAPSEVFITDHFKTLNLSKPDCFTLSKRPSFLLLLTTQITCCSASPDRYPCNPACQGKFPR